MGGDSALPYIYTPQRTVYPFSAFNPREVSQAAARAPKENANTKAKKDGPLINFNEHPDSYEMAIGRNTKYKPMPAYTKAMVKVIRWIQFALRLLEEVGALGLLVCVICFTGMKASVSWIIRIAPAWDAVITVYAIYHLIRPAKARTPASSASYHMFALFMDVGLIPFYVFICIFTDQNYQKDPGSKGRWSTLFDKKDTTTTSTVLYATFLGSAVMAGLHIFSAIFDLWLVILFRMISNLPPDVNPLEDNLTSRSARTNKHKYKNSEATLTDSIAEKRPGYLSGSTVSVDDRSRLSIANKNTEDARRVSWNHSRTGSEATFSPHNPETARWSRQNYEGMSPRGIGPYQQPQSARTSFVNVQTPSRSGPTSPSKNASCVEYYEVRPSPPRSSDRADWHRPTSYPASRSGSDLAKPTRYSSPALPNAAPLQALVKSQQKQGLLSDNWFVSDDASDNGTPASPTKTRSGDSFEPQPLKMNPPTPPPPPKQIEWPLSNERQPKRNALTDRRDKGNGDLSRHLTVQSAATNTSSVYSESAPSLKSSRVNGNNGTPKSKHYGDLTAATRGVRGVKSTDTIKTTGTVDASTMDSTGMGALGGYGYGAPDPMPKQLPRDVNRGNGRVVSRTGIDIVDVQTIDPVVSGAYGIRGRRDVSGKIAEEGRGGGGWRSLNPRRF